MADRGDTHYSVPALNQWFLVSSVVLLGSVIWMVLDDWSRPWKAYQREFQDIEIAKVQAERELLTQAGALEAEVRLAAQVEAAQATLASREGDLQSASESRRLAEGDLWNAVEAAKKVLSAFNWDRYIIEEERRRLGDPSFRKSDIESSERALNEAKGLQEELQAKRDAADAEVNALKRVVSDAQAALASGTRDLSRVRSRLAQLDRASMSRPEKLADVIRDAPGLDFVKPSLKVNKVVLDRLTFELNFTKKKRIDMCQTCHLGAERSGYESEPQPHTSHPRLDLYVTNKSPHPVNQFGCTICHRGSGEALDFIRADHRPADKDQVAQWANEHHWHKQHHWDYPMLASNFTEASCVQCHKSSMDLISADAPVVSEGYRLVERYGCYSCHKIDWFPTKRRPGPTLTNLQAKLSSEFIASWLADPKQFRPTTWMPRFFQQENYAAGQTVAISKYGQGRAIEGREWDQAAIAAITAFLESRAPKHPMPPVPVAGDAHRGRESMRLVGCLACHNMAPYDGQAEAKDLALERRGTNEHGPNLRGVATKLSAEWLFAWIKDPSAYWPQTRMPNLRLDDQEAADITAYIMEDPDGIFRDVQDGWETKPVAMPQAQMLEVLGEHARWLFARDGRAAIEARLEGRDAAARWDDVADLKVAVGEKLVGQYGCFSCHEIEGMQDWMPIGTELSNWGSKTVDKLDFGPGAGEFGLDANYREGWLMQKLHAPRSFDRKKIKNPTERLRMPEFGFTDEQRQAIATFVVGLVDDEVQLAKMVPTPEQLAVDAGMRAVRQNNCVACHMVDPGTVTYIDGSGATQTVRAELLNFEEQKVPSAHDLASVKADAESYEADEVSFRVLRPEPQVGKKPGDKLFIPLDKLVALDAPAGGDLVRLVTDYYYGGIEIHDSSRGSGDDAFWYASGAAPDADFAVGDVDGKLRDHSAEPYDKVRWTFAPPVLWDEGAKLQRNWFFSFLKDVVPLRPQVRVRMPSFEFAPGEAEAVADYFAYKSAGEWPATLVRSWRLARGLDAEAAGRECGVSAATIVEIEHGSRAATRASFAAVAGKIRAAGFQSRAAVDPQYELTRTRAAAYLADRRAQDDAHLSKGEALAVRGVNCFQCHFRLGQRPPADPIAWAPDLNHARDRLREDWVRDWIADPSLIYPGTAMPANFSSSSPQYQEHYPGSTNADQVRVVLEWLYNFDRMYMRQ